MTTGDRVASPFTGDKGTAKDVKSLGDGWWSFVVRFDKKDPGGNKAPESLFVKTDKPERWETIE